MKVIALLVLTSVVLVSAGCSTPFKRSYSASGQINPATASKVTVQSTTTSSLKKAVGNDYSPASVSINGEFVGDFSRAETSFSYEVNPGPISIDFCLEGYSPKCSNYRAVVEPNKHYFLEYSFDSQFMTIYRKVNVIKVVPYGNASTPTAAEKIQTPPQSNQKLITPNQTGMGLEVAKKKCIELGFKVGTESFGNCVLKVAN